MGQENISARNSLVLTDDLWRRASTQMPGREAEYLLGNALYKDLDCDPMTSYAVAVMADFANWYPEKFPELEAAIPLMLDHLDSEGHNKQALAGELASQLHRFFIREFKVPGIELTEMDKARFERFEKIAQILARLSATSPESL